MLKCDGGTVNIPLHHFRFSDNETMSFEIDQIEQLPSVARSAHAARTNFYSIMWVTGGVGWRYIDFQAYPIQPHTLYFITPGQVHSWNIQAPLTGYAILFLRDFLLFQKDYLHRFDFFHRIDQAPVIDLNDDQVEPFQHLVEVMMREYYSNQPGRMQVIQSYLQIFLIQAQRYYAASDTTNPPRADLLLIDAFQRSIDQHYLSVRTVRQYANMLAITPEHLTTVAKQRTGSTASGLIRSRIIMEAKRLLAYTDQTVAQVCHQLHFDDPSYFSRYFKRETGQSPVTFRRNILEKHQES